MVEEQRYVPAQCNIGPREIRRRRAAGMLGAAAGLLLVGVLVLSHAPAVSYGLVFIPSSLAAIGLLQSKEQFCVLYALQGRQNAADAETPQAVTDKQTRQADARKSFALLRGAFLYGLAATALTLGLRLLLG